MSSKNYRSTSGSTQGCYTYEASKISRIYLLQRLKWKKYIYHMYNLHLAPMITRWIKGKTEKDSQWNLLNEEQERLSNFGSCCKAAASGHLAPGLIKSPTPPGRQVLSKSRVQVSRIQVAETSPAPHWTEGSTITTSLPEALDPRPPFRLSTALGLISEGNEANHFSTTHTVPDAVKLTCFPFSSISLLGSLGLS